MENFDAVKMKPKHHVTTIPIFTGNDVKLKCVVGNLTANIRSKLIAERLMIDVVPHSISTEMKYLNASLLTKSMSKKKGNFESNYSSI